MTYRISTDLPITGTVVLTEIFRADTASSVYRIVDVLSNAPPDDGHGRFVYDDMNGDVTKFYRIIFYDSFNVILKDTGPFSPHVIGGPDIPTLVRLDTNTQAIDNFRYCTPGGMGISDAIIRVYRASDYDLNNRDLALGVTRTNGDGRWAAPVMVPTGMEYVIVFTKEGMYGPDIRRVTV